MGNGWRRAAPTLYSHPGRCEGGILPYERFLQVVPVPYRLPMKDWSLDGLYTYMSFKAHQQVWGRHITVTDTHGADRAVLLYMFHNPFSGDWSFNAYVIPGPPGFPFNGEMQQLYITGPIPGHGDRGDTPPETGWTVSPDPGMPAGAPVPTTHPHDAGRHPKLCRNAGCKCKCARTDGGASCCIVSKKLLPLTNSENLPWVIEAKTGVGNLCFRDSFKPLDCNDYAVNCKPWPDTNNCSK